MKPTLIKFMTNILFLVIIGNVLFDIVLYLILNSLLEQPEMIRVLLLNLFFALFFWTIFTPLYHRFIYNKVT